ncbi:MAG: hypothetical protein V8T90_05295 [Victivallales bacterium]
MQPKPRNNYSRLPWEIRSRILGLLHNGAEYDDIRRDPQVAAELKNKKLSLHNTTFQAIRRSDEYRDYVARATEDSAAKKAEAITRAVLENNDALGSVTDIARYELAKLIREEVKATSGDEDSIKRIRSLASSLAAVSNPAKELSWQKKLDRANAEIEELKAEIAQLNQEIETLKTGSGKKPGAAGMTPETLAEVEEKIKLL